MKKVNRNILIVLSFFLIGIGGIVWIGLMPTNLSAQLHKNYIFLVVAYFLYTYFLWITFVRHKIDLFEPLVFVSAMYFALLIFAPMVCRYNGGMHKRNNHFFDFVFLLFYWILQKRLTKGKT